MKPARLRPRAEQDLVDAARHYAKEGGFTLGERMFDAAIACRARVRHAWVNCVAFLA